MEDKKARGIAIAAIMMCLISAAITPVSAQTENEFADEFFKLKKEGNDNKI